MKYLILILFPVYLNAQSVGISSPSFRAWGQTPQIGHASIEYKNAEIHYFYSTKSFDFSNYVVGASYSFPYKFISVGGIATHRPFPTVNAVQLNFLLRLNIPVNRFIISYQHISNGFGIRKSPNRGYDSVTLYIRL